MFGSNSGTIKNVGVVDSYFYGRDYVGGVCGYNEGTITGCYNDNTGEVSGNNLVGGVCGQNYGGIITGCYNDNTGAVSGNDDYVGGVCGENVNGGTISDCYNTGQVHGYKNCVGGVCGKNFDGTITSCYNTGAVSGNGGSVGGVCGDNSGTITSCYNTGEVRGKMSVGGVCGSNGGTITGCYNTGQVSGDNQVGGVCGYNSSTITGCYNYNTGAVSGSKDVSGSSYVGGVCGDNSGTITGCYNKGTVSGSSSCTGGVCGKNVGRITGCYNIGTVSGNNQVGGVCGKNIGIITGCYNTELVSGNNQVGGVCGENGSTITGCYNTGTVNGYQNYVGGVCGYNYVTITGCYNSGEVSGNEYVGGVCGYNGGIITGCYYLANSDDGNGGKTEGQFKSDEVCSLLNTALKTVNASVRFYRGANYPELIMNVPSLAEGVYQISNKEELYAFAQLVNKGETSANAVLTANITVNKDVLDSEGNLNNDSGFETWTPIGNNQNPYTGTFDGQGHTISGLYFKDIYVGYVGLFGCSSGTIRNVGVIDSYFEGSNYIGGVCGCNHTEGDFSQATIENCYNTGTVNGNSNIGGVCGYNHAEGNNSTATIENCYNTGTVSGNSNIGGVCGYNHAESNYSAATIKNCYNTGTVSCSGDCAGGVCGYNIAEGDFSTATIENCYNTGTVSCSGEYAGGVCGNNRAKNDNGSRATITNCYYNSEKYTGNAVGSKENVDFDNVEGKTTAQFMSGEVCYLMNNGITDGTQTWHQNIDMEGATKDPYPVLDNTHGVVYQCSVCTSAYSNTEGAKGAHDYVDDGNGFLTCEACGTKSYQPATLNASSQYEISNAGQLYWFAALVNGDESVCDYDAVTNPTGTQQNSAACAKLTADIVVNSGLAEGKTMLESLEYDASDKVTNGSSFVAWTPIGYESDDDYANYEGTFDGDNHTISGLYFNDSKVESIGLFGSVYEGYVKNVGVVDSYFCGNAWVGGVCGWAGNSRIENCYNEGTVYGSYNGTGGVCGTVSMSTIENCYNEGTVFCLTGYAGGVCGDVEDGTVINCHNSGSVSGGYYVGGVCGMVNICDTDKSYMINCYNTGDVKGVGTSGSLTGGVCGFFNHTICLNCYNTGTVSATAEEVGAVLGRTLYSYCNNCYYLEGCNAEDTSFTNEFGTKMSSAAFGSGEVAYLLSQGSTVTDGENTTYYSGASWGQQLGTDDYPVLSDYKVIKAAEGDNKTYWATFSNQSSDMDLSGLTVYTATVSEGILTLTPCTNHIVAKGEGVLVKGNSEYLNALMLNDKTETPEANNDLVATPAEPTVINATTGHVLYRLTYNNSTDKTGLGFYLSLVKDGNNNVIENSVGSQLKATPGKAYLDVTTAAATPSSSNVPALGFAFPSDGETTGISEMVIKGNAGISGAANADGRIYNLQGQQVSAPAKGLYIKNNKKVIVK